MLVKAAAVFLMGLALASVVTGCGSIDNVIAGPHIYGGVRHDLWYMHHGEIGANVAAIFDTPLSAVLDTALLPLTGFAELSRAIFGWPPPSPRLYPPPPPAENIENVVKSGNSFGLDIYSRLAAQVDGNLVFSPFGAHAALTMAYAGAGGPTAEQMAGALHLSRRTNPSPAFGKLMKVVQSEDEQLAIANALWGQKGSPLDPEYISTAKENYNAELSELDFREVGASRKTINEWLVRHAQEGIREGAIDAATRLLLTNAVRFKGRWDRAFEKASTEDGDFHVSRDKTAKAGMMHRKGDFGYMETEDFQLLEMPYASDEASMLVFLPRTADGLAGLEKSLTEENVTVWLKWISRQEVSVTFPKFKCDTQMDLADALKAAGMWNAFSMELANFRAMAAAEVHLSGVRQAASVVVDEEGAEAAAAIAGLTKTDGENSPTFVADHPFLFLIRHRSTGAILLVGRVVEPKAE